MSSKRTLDAPTFDGNGIAIHHCLLNVVLHDYHIRLGQGVHYSTPVGGRWVPQ